MVQREQVSLMQGKSHQKDHVLFLLHSLCSRQVLGEYKILDTTKLKESMVLLCKISKSMEIQTHKEAATTDIYQKQSVWASQGMG